jgi:hypothetical protein
MCLAPRILSRSEAPFEDAGVSQRTYTRSNGAAETNGAITLGFDGSACVAGRLARMDRIVEMNTDGIRERRSSPRFDPSARAASRRPSNRTTVTLYFFVISVTSFLRVKL